MNHYAADNHDYNASHHILHITTFVGKNPHSNAGKSLTQEKPVCLSAASDAYR